MSNPLPISVWTYDFNDTGIESVLNDLKLIEWLPDDILGKITEAFSEKIIGKLPNGFCIKRLDAFWDKIELYTFL